MVYGQIMSMAAGRGTAPLKSVDELRTEVRRLHEAISNISDPGLKRELAARAFQLAQQAEEIAQSPEDPEMIRADINRYCRLLADTTDQLHKQILQELLQFAAERLQRVSKEPRHPPAIAAI